MVQQVQWDIQTFIFAFEYSHIPFFIIAFFGTTSNALLLIAFINDPLKCFRNSGTYLVMNLSLSDLLTSICEILFHFHASVTARFDWVFQFLSLTFGIVSTTSIASISIDRFLLATYPLKHRHLFTGKVMILWLSGIWLSSVVFPISALLCGNKINFMLAISYFCMSVILISAVMYASTYSTLKKHWKNIAEQNSTESRAQEMRILKEQKFLKTIIIIASIAFASFMPSMIYAQLYEFSLFSQDNLAAMIIYDLLQLMLYANFAINPLIYVLRLPNYRKTFYLIYNCKRTS
jgi:hypothetical protein